MSAAAAALGTQVPADANLLPGQSYTFSFGLGNWFTLPSEATVLAELQNYAPDFISNAQVREMSGLSPLTNYFDVTFTYVGDGSDVASDVAAEMIQAFSQGGDKFSLNAMNMGTVGLSAASDVSQALGSVGDALGTGLGNALSKTTAGLGATWTIIIVLGIAAVLLFEVGGVAGLKKTFRGE